MLSEMTLRGVDGIKRVFMREPKLDGIDPETLTLTPTLTLTRTTASRP